MSTDPDTDVTAEVARIRTDIDETVDVYNLDGTGKNSYPVSAAMSRHARSLLAAIQAVLDQHRPIRNLDGQLRCDKCSFAFPTPWPCGEVEAITRALVAAEDRDEGFETLLEEQQ